MGRNYTFLRKSVMLIAALTFTVGVNADSISVKSSTPWGALEDLTDVSFGTINVNSTVEDGEYQLYLTDVELSDVKITSDNDVFTARIDTAKLTDYDGNTYYNLYYVAKTGNAVNTVDTITGNVTLSAGDAAFTVPCKAYVRNLNASTIADFRTLTQELTPSVTCYYTGDAVVQWNWRDNSVWVADETGGVLLQGIFGQNLYPGQHLSFAASKGAYSGTNYFWGIKDVTVSSDWTYPSPVTVSGGLTEDDYGKYVDIKNVEFDSETVQHPLWPREDGKDPRWMFFKDEDGNTYTVETPSYNPYADGISEDWKGKKLEIIGGVIGSSMDNGAPQPYINPQVIRPMEPTDSLKEGNYNMTAKSYIYEEDDDWTVKVEQDPTNPYRYKLSNFVKGTDGGTVNDIYAELNDKCDSLFILTGQQLRATDVSDIYLATADSFDRSGNTPDQEPSPKGTLIKASFDSATNTLTFNNIIDFCVYMNEWADPESSYYSFRWSHYGIWYAGGKMVYQEDETDGINDMTVQGSNAKVVARYSLDGKLITSPVKGINIVKMSDGTIKKVVIK